jgi:hypothetical protein
VTTPYREALPAAPPRELRVDVPSEPATGEPRRWGGAVGTGLALLFVALSVLSLRSSSHFFFFFLPVVLPFGFGGGRVFRGLAARVNRRILRLDHGALQLQTRRPWGTTSAAPIDATSGVFVAVAPSGLSVNGVARVDVRFVGQRGSLSVRVFGQERAQDLKRRFKPFMEEAGFDVASAETPLQGGIVTRANGASEELEWRTGQRASVGAAVLAVLFLVASVVFLVRVDLELLPLLVVAVAVGSFVYLAGFASARRRTVLARGPNGWSLRVWRGPRSVASMGAPDPLEARVVSRDLPDPFGSGVARRETALELRSDGEVVATVGAELSAPELHWIEQRLAAPLILPGAAEPDAPRRLSNSGSPST